MQEFKTKLLTAKPDNQTVWMIHADLYRTAGFKEIESLSIPELWGKPHIITIIEWADKIKKHLPPSTINIYLKRDAK